MVNITFINEIFIYIYKKLYNYYLFNIINIVIILIDYSNNAVQGLIIVKIFKLFSQHFLPFLNFFDYNFDF